VTGGPCSACLESMGVESGGGGEEMGGPEERIKPKKGERGNGLWEERGK